VSCSGCEKRRAQIKASIDKLKSALAQGAHPEQLFTLFHGTDPLSYRKKISSGKTMSSGEHNSHRK
jgi:hypothetical protein